MGKGSSERLDNLPEATQLGNGGWRLTHSDAGAPSPYVTQILWGEEQTGGTL